MNIEAKSLTMGDSKLFENLVDREQVMINHVVVPAGDGFEAHETDSNVYLHILRGTISLTFADGAVQDYAGGQVVEILHKTLMKIDNKASGPLEMIVIKAPNPKTLV